MSSKPRIILFSSSEAKKFMQKLSAKLIEWSEPIMWTTIIETSSYPIPSLIEKLKTADMAILIAKSDDVYVKKGIEVPAARDNIYFELGLAIGTLGVERTIMIPETGVNIPSDYKAVTMMKSCDAKYLKEDSSEELDVILSDYSNNVQSHYEKIITEIHNDHIINFNEDYDFAPKLIGKMKTFLLNGSDDFDSNELEQELQDAKSNGALKFIKPDQFKLMSELLSDLGRDGLSLSLLECAYTYFPNKLPIVVAYIDKLSSLNYASNEQKALKMVREHFKIESNQFTQASISCQISERDHLETVLYVYYNNELYDELLQLIDSLDHINAYENKYVTRQFKALAYKNLGRIDDFISVFKEVSSESITYKELCLFGDTLLELGFLNEGYSIMETATIMNYNERSLLYLVGIIIRYKVCREYTDPNDYTKSQVNELSMCDGYGEKNDIYRSVIPLLYKVLELDRYQDTEVKRYLRNLGAKREYDKIVSANYSVDKLYSDAKTDNAINGDNNSTDYSWCLDEYLMQYTTGIYTEYSTRHDYAVKKYDEIIDNVATKLKK